LQNRCEVQAIELPNTLLRPIGSPIACIPSVIVPSLWIGMLPMMTSCWRVRRMSVPVASTRSAIAIICVPVSQPIGTEKPAKT
jgi:hypothetical protein